MKKMKKMRNFFVMLFLLAITQFSYGQIAGTSHDFSGDTWNATGEICVVCHTPHNADISVLDAPLWNHEVTNQTFVLYNSPTFDGASSIGQPTASSKLCLSCHDGVTAVDNFGGTTSGTIYITGSENLGNDLRSDHPISFTYDDALATVDGGLYSPSTATSGLGNTIDADMLIAGQLQCASCHDVHSDAFSNFLRKSNTNSALCLTCHDK